MRLSPSENGVAPAFSAAASSPAAYSVAPYVDMTSWPPPNLARYAKASKNPYYTLAFMQSYQGNQCELAWGGTILPNDPTYGEYFAKQLLALRALGGDGIISLGGAAGTDVANECTDATSLASAIEAVIGDYQITHLDWDIEGAEPYDSTSVALRSQALALVQQHYASAGTPIVLSYTLPVLPSGMPQPILDVVKSALSAGVKLSVVNVMAMDYGDGAAPNPQGKMGAYAIQAAKSTLRQLRGIGFPLGAQPYGAVGVTPMIGQNDVHDEVFELSDARKLVAWSRKRHVGRLSFWAAQRDKPCRSGSSGASNSSASDTCSGIVQKPWAFDKIFATF